eukprot:g7649.t1
MRQTYVGLDVSSDAADLEPFGPRNKRGILSGGNLLKVVALSAAFTVGGFVAGRGVGRSQAESHVQDFEAEVMESVAKAGSSSQVQTYNIDGQQNNQCADPEPQVGRTDIGCFGLKEGKDGCKQTCNDGYYLVSGVEGNHKCKRESKESSVIAFFDQPQCAPSTCSEPEEQNGRMAKNCAGLKTGEVGCEVTCAPGFFSHVLGAQGTKHCEADAGEDTASFRGLPECIAATCEMPAAHPGLIADDCEGLHTGEGGCEMMCAKGYYAVEGHEGSFRCEADIGKYEEGEAVTTASFSGTPPVCKPLLCPAPESQVGRVAVMCNNRMEGSNNCLVMCDNGYKVVKGRMGSQTCTKTSETTAAFNTMPVCAAATCEAPEQQVGRVAQGCNGLTTGESGCSVTCANGYFKVAGTEGVKTCQGDDGPISNFFDLPSCSAAMCVAPAYQPGRVATGCTNKRTVATGCTNKRTGDEGCVVQCDKGYTLVAGVQGAKPCTANDGALRTTSAFKNLPTCAPVSCDIPALEPGLIILGCTNQKTGDSACYMKCASGYHLVKGANGYQECQGDELGHSSFVNAPECEASQCDLPASQPGLVISESCSNQHTGDSDCTMTCAPGYYAASGQEGAIMCAAITGLPTASFVNVPQCKSECELEGSLYSSTTPYRTYASNADVASKSTVFAMVDAHVVIGTAQECANMCTGFCDIWNFKEYSEGTICELHNSNVYEAVRGGVASDVAFTGYKNGCALRDLSYTCPRSKWAVEASDAYSCRQMCQEDDRCEGWNFFQGFDDQALYGGKGGSGYNSEATLCHLLEFGENGNKMQTASSEKGNKEQRQQAPKEQSQALQSQQAYTEQCQQGFSRGCGSAMTSCASGWSNMLND